MNGYASKSELNGSYKNIDPLMIEYFQPYVASMNTGIKKTWAQAFSFYFSSTGKPGE